MNPMKLYALGPKGTNGHHVAQIAIDSFKQHHPYICYPYLNRPINLEFSQRNQDVLSVVCAEGHLGVVPIENSEEGLVSDVIKGFWLSSQDVARVCVIGEIELPIQHCLLAHPDADVAGITQVMSHPQALGQCSTYLDTYLPSCNRIPVSSTAQAARMVSESKYPHTSIAIASLFAAEVYGLKIVVQGVENTPHNATRFHIVAPAKGAMSVELHNRTALIFETPDVSGALVAALNTISVGGVNLSSIHSISLGTPGRFAFYCEFDRHQNDLVGSAILTRLKTLTNRLIVLGSFPQGAKRNGGVK